jgi:hypothetical protein
MTSPARMTGPRGPRFYDQGDELTFVLILDGNTRFGPFPATEQHMSEHPEAYRQYLAEKAAEARGEAASDFPGRPVISAMDPPEGRPEPRPPKVRGRQGEARP